MSVVTEYTVLDPSSAVELRERLAKSLTREMSLWVEAQELLDEVSARRRKPVKIKEEMTVEVIAQDDDEILIFGKIGLTVARLETGKEGLRLSLFLSSP